MQITLGIDQEVGAGDDFLALAEPVQHGGVAAGSGSWLDHARLEAPFAAIDENSLPVPGVEHG